MPPTAREHRGTPDVSVVALTRGHSVALATQGPIDPKASCKARSSEARSPRALPSDSGTADWSPLFQS